MKAKSASTLKALVQIDSMAEVAAKALMKAETRAQSKSKNKVSSKAKAAEADFFTMPF